MLPTEMVIRTFQRKALNMKYLKPVIHLKVNQIPIYTYQHLLRYKRATELLDAKH